MKRKGIRRLQWQQLTQKLYHHLRATMVFHIKFLKGTQILENIVSIRPVMTVGDIRITKRAIRIWVAVWWTTIWVSKRNYRWSNQQKSFHGCFYYHKSYCLLSSYYFLFLTNSLLCAFDRSPGDLWRESYTITRGSPIPDRGCALRIQCAESVICVDIVAWRLIQFGRWLLTVDSSETWSTVVVPTAIDDTFDM